MNTLRKESKITQIKGPFRGIIITSKNKTSKDFFEILPQLTNHNHNLINYNGDMQKCIIYYKTPYDAAIVLEKLKNQPNITKSIFYDHVSKKLMEKTLYIEVEVTIEILAIIKCLKGTISKKQISGVQVEFPSFRYAALAYEELKDEFKVKFAYKSLAPSTKIMAAPNNPVNKPIIELEKDIKAVLEQYKGWTTEIKKQFRNVVADIINKEENNKNN